MGQMAQSPDNSRILSIPRSRIRVFRKIFQLKYDQTSEKDEKCMRNTRIQFSIGHISQNINTEEEKNIEIESAKFADSCSLNNGGRKGTDVPEMACM